MLAPWKKSYDKPRQLIKKQRYHFATKGLYSQSYDFSNSHVQKWELDHKEGWVPRIWCFQTVVKKTLESPLDFEENKPVILKEINPEYSLEGLMLKLKFQYFGHPIFWPTHWKRFWCWERLRAGGEGGNRGWDVHEFEQTLGDNEGQGSLACCSPWGRKESDTTEQLNSKDILGLLLYI